MYITIKDSENINRKIPRIANTDTGNIIYITADLQYTQKKKIHKRSICDFSINSNATSSLLNTDWSV